MESLKNYVLIDFDDEILKEDAYNFIFNNCDEVEFLSEYKVGFIESLEDVTCSNYPGLANSIIEEREDISWGMRGKIYKFKLDDYMKTILREIGIANFLYLDINNKFLLQNTTLIKNNKVVYSVCTHENLEEFDTRFKNELAAICKDKLCSSEMYKELADKNKKHSKEDIEKNIEILNSLCGYINKELNAFIYSPPKYEDITFNNYIDIAQNALSSKVVEQLTHLTSFMDFISSNFQHTKEISGSIINNSVSLSNGLNKLAVEILNECKYLSAFVNFTN